MVLVQPTNVITNTTSTTGNYSFPTPLQDFTNNTSGVYGQLIFESSNNFINAPTNSYMDICGNYLMTYVDFSGVIHSGQLPEGTYNFTCHAINSVGASVVGNFLLDIKIPNSITPPPPPPVTTQTYPIPELNGPVKGFFYWQANYVTTSYTSDGTPTNAPQYAAITCDSSQNFSVSLTYPEDGTYNSAPYSVTHLSGYMVGESGGVGTTSTPPILNYPKVASSDNDNPIPGGTNTIALFTGYSHAGLNCQNMLGYDPYQGNNILLNSQQFFRNNNASNNNYLIGFCMGGGWNYTGGWNTVVSNYYPTNGPNASYVYQSATLSGADVNINPPITSTFNATGNIWGGLPSNLYPNDDNFIALNPSLIYQSIQYEQNNKYFTYVQPFARTATNHTSFYINGDYDNSNQHGGSYNPVYVGFGGGDANTTQNSTNADYVPNTVNYSPPLDLGAGGVYSTYQYITQKNVPFSYIETTTGLTQSGIGTGCIIYSADPKVATYDWNDGGGYTNIFLKSNTTPLQVNCMIFDLESWGKLCWPYPNGPYAYPGAYSYGGGYNNHNPPEPSPFIWPETDKLYPPNGVDMYDPNNPTEKLKACYSSAQDFLNLFLWIKKCYPNMKIIVTTSHSSGNFADGRGIMRVGADEFVPLYKAGPCQINGANVVSNTPGIYLTSDGTSTGTPLPLIDLYVPQLYTCNIGTTCEYVANSTLPWLVTDTTQAGLTPTLESYQNTIYQGTAYQRYGLNAIAPAVNIGNFGGQSQYYDCYDHGGTNDASYSNLYYYLADYNNQTSNTNQSSGSSITDTTGASSYFPTYYGAGNQPIDFNEKDYGIKYFFQSLMAAYDSSGVQLASIEDQNVGGGCFQWVNGNIYNNSSQGRPPSITRQAGVGLPPIGTNGTNGQNIPPPPPSSSSWKQVNYMGYYFDSTIFENYINVCIANGVTHINLEFITYGNPTTSGTTTYTNWSGSNDPTYAYPGIPLSCQDGTLYWYQFGTTLQQQYKTMLSQNNIKLMASFGGAACFSVNGTSNFTFLWTYSESTYKLTVYGGIYDTIQLSAQALAADLVTYVQGNLIDGIDLDIENIPDNIAYTNYSDIINYLGYLSQYLKNAGIIVSHAPQTPYWNTSTFPIYQSVEQTYGSYIDFYNWQYYNQGPVSQTESTLFVDDAPGFGTAVLQLYNSGSGCPLHKIVIGAARDGVGGTSYIIGANLGPNGASDPNNASDPTAWSNYTTIIKNQQTSQNSLLQEWYNSGGVMIWIYRTDIPAPSSDPTNVNIMTFFNALKR